MHTIPRFSTRRASCLVACALLALVATAAVARASDQVYFPRNTNLTNMIVARINAETVRIDISVWYLNEHLISESLVARFQAGVPVRVIGDRGAIFEVDPNTKKEFYFLANAGVPIRLRFNPTWYPEIDHWKVGIFVGQGVAEFGSANWVTGQLTAASSTNYPDETAMFVDDPTLFGALETKFDTIWNDTTTEPRSLISGPPYLKNWYDACASEPTGNCSDFKTLYPNPAPMNISTARLAPNNPYPADMIWGQGPDFNNRLVTEINNENTKVRFAIYRLTVDNVTTAIINKFKAGVPVQVCVEPSEYQNRKWPEFWLTHANEDRMWAAGIPMKQRLHTGITHMKMLVTSNYATNASSNYAAAWQRDTDYFVSASLLPTVRQAMQDYFDNSMWNDTTAFTPFVPQPADAPTLSSPSNGATGLSTKPTLTWNTAVFATSYDVYVGTSTSSMAFVGNVPAQLNNNPPSTYSLTLPTALNGGTTYFWKVVSRTFAADVRPSLLNPSSTQSFTTSGTSTPPPPSALPSPWSNVDIGTTGLAGSASYSNGVFTVSGAGADVWGTADSFQYVYQTLSGDGQIVSRVTSEQNTGANAKAGVMFRETLTSGSTNVILNISPTGNVEFMSRSSSGGTTSWLSGTSSAFPVWLKLVRSGNTITGFVSADGSTWTQVGTTTVAMATGITTGLVVCSHSTSTLNTSTFDNVSVSTTAAPPPPPLPSPWTNGDVGSTGIAGSAAYSGGVFTVKGAGADIWGTADAFQYVYQTLSGDGQIVARVTSEQNTSSLAKAGVMLRATTAAGSAHVILDMKPGGEAEFMTRSTTGGTTSWLAGAAQAFPAWLKLQRVGTTVTGFVSADGVTWTTVGATTVSMGTSITVGMVVCSHTTSALNTSTFDNVTVGPPN